MIRTTSLAFLLSISLSTTAFAEKNSEITPKLLPAGSPTITQEFDEAIDSTGSALKGEWNVLHGVLVGKELAADKHAAVFNYQKKNRDSAVRFSFKLDGSTNGFHFSLNHAKGHLFRVMVSPTGLSVNLDKDKNDPASKAIVMANAKGNFEQGKWYTILIEMQGDKVAAQTDNGLTVEASHTSLNTDKPNYRFVMKGDSLSIDDLRIWEAK